MLSRQKTLGTEDPYCIADAFGEKRPMTSKKMILITLLCSCGASEPQEQPKPAIVEPPLPETKTPEPEVDDDLKDADKLEGTIDIDEIMQLGVRTHEAKEKLADMHRVVIFLECMERRTGKKLVGADLERHIRRNSKHSQACKKEFSQLSEEQIAERVQGSIDDFERSQDGN